MIRHDEVRIAIKHCSILVSGLFFLLFVCTPTTIAQTYYYGSNAVMSGSTIVGASGTYIGYNASYHIVGAKATLVNPNGALAAQSGVVCGWDSAEAMVAIDYPAPAGVWRSDGIHSYGTNDPATGCQLYGLPNTSAYVSVNGPVIDYFYVSPSTACPNVGVTLYWGSHDGTSANIDGQAVAASGSMTVSSSVTKTYTFTVSNWTGSVTATTTLTIYPMPTASISASSSSICVGGSVTLNWNTTNAVSATLNGGSAALNGSTTYWPTVTTTYTLQATDSCGRTASSSVTVTVNSSPSVVFSSNVSSICPGGSATLTWDTTGATSVTLDGASVALDGSQVVSPTTTKSYTLVTSNNCGSVIKTLTISVATPAPVVTSHLPTSAKAGNSYALIVKGQNLSNATLTINNPMNGPALSISEINSTTEGDELAATLSIPTGAVLTDYTLAVTNPCGSVTKPLAVNSASSPSPAGPPSITGISVDGESYVPVPSTRTTYPVTVFGTNLEGATVSTTSGGATVGTPVYDPEHGTLIVPLTLSTTVPEGGVDLDFTNSLGWDTTVVIVGVVIESLRVSPAAVTLELGDTKELRARFFRRSIICTQLNFHRSIATEDLPTRVLARSITTCVRKNSSEEPTSATWSKDGPNPSAIEYVDSNGEIIPPPTGARVTESAENEGTAYAQATFQSGGNSFSASSQASVTAPVHLPVKDVPVIKIKVTGGRWGTQRGAQSGDQFEAPVVGANAIWNPQSAEFGFPIRILGESFRELNTTTHPSSLVRDNINDSKVSEDGILTQNQFRALIVGDANAGLTSTTKVNMYYVKGLEGGHGLDFRGDNRPGIGDDGTSRTFAHEIGHVLNLPHVIPTLVVPVPENLMYSGGSGTRLTKKQINGVPSGTGAYFYVITQMNITFP